MTAVIFSLEMCKTEITMRLLSAEAGIRLSHMRAGTMSEQDWQKIVRRMTRDLRRAAVHRRFAEHDDDGDPGEGAAAQAAQRPKLIVVDYLQLMTSGKRVESRQQEVSEFSRQMKLLAKELEVPVIAIASSTAAPSSAPTSGRCCRTCASPARWSRTPTW